MGGAVPPPPSTVAAPQGLQKRVMDFARCCVQTGTWRSLRAPMSEGRPRAFLALTLATALPRTRLFFPPSARPRVAAERAHGWELNPPDWPSTSGKQPTRTAGPEGGFVGHRGCPLLSPRPCAHVHIQGRPPSPVPRAHTHLKQGGPEAASIRHLVLMLHTSASTRSTDGS